MVASQPMLHIGEAFWRAPWEEEGRKRKGEEKEANTQKKKVIVKNGTERREDFVSTRKVAWTPLKIALRLAWGAKQKT